MKKHGIKKSEKNAYQELLVKFSMVKPLSECMDVPDDAYDDGAFAKSAIQQMQMLAKVINRFSLRSV